MKPPCGTPCNECPFVRTSIAGWLGPWTPETLLYSLAMEPFACHTTMDDESKMRVCTGAAIYLNNKFERSRNAEMREAQDTVKPIDISIKDSVFKNRLEFLDHHDIFKDTNRAAS